MMLALSFHTAGRASEGPRRELVVRRVSRRTSGPPPTTRLAGPGGLRTEGEGTHMWETSCGGEGGRGRNLRIYLCRRGADMIRRLIE